MLCSTMIITLLFHLGLLMNNNNLLLLGSRVLFICQSKNDDIESDFSKYQGFVGWKIFH